MSFSIFRKPTHLHDKEYTFGAEEIETDDLDMISKFCWSPAVYLWGHRAKKNFAYADWIGLDFDDGPSLAEMTKAFSDVECIIGTTKSHQKHKGDKPPCDRFRIVMRLEHRCESLRDYEATLRDLTSRYDADKQATDGARYFRPCTITHSTIGQTDLYTQEIVAAPEQKPIVTTRPAGGSFYKTPLYCSVFKYPHLVRKRNCTLFLIASDLVRQGLGESEIMSEIMMLIPDFSEREKRAIVKSALKV